MTTTILPPAPTTTLLEPSFVDMIAAIERSDELSAERKRHWVCSSRQIAEGLDRPLAVIPARWSANRIAVSQLHHARLGVTAKTLANHKANVKAALRWFSQEHDPPQRGVRLTHDWARFRGDLDEHVWERVSSLVRYCSARGIGPLEVNDTFFSQYWSYRAPAVVPVI